MAIAFVECNESFADHDENSACTRAPKAFQESCTTVVDTIFKASNGNRDNVQEYMTEVCDQSLLKSWKQEHCRSLASSIFKAMSFDAFENRQHLTGTDLCKTFWAQFKLEQEKRIEKERAEQQAVEEKEAQKRADAVKLAAEKRAAAEKKRIEQEALAAKEAAARAEAEKKAAAEHAASKKEHEDEKEHAAAKKAATKKDLKIKVADGGKLPATKSDGKAPNSGKLLEHEDEDATAEKHTEVHLKGPCDCNDKSGKKVPCDCDR